jgi:hypothetical protein
MEETVERWPRRLSIRVDHAMRVRYSSMVRITPKRKLFSIRMTKKCPWPEAWHGTN